MASGTCRGQAVIELTVILTLILFIVSAGIAVTALIKKEMKHDFINARSPEPSSISKTEVPGLDGIVRFFPTSNLRGTLNQLNSEGWTEDRRLKIPDGLVIEMKNGDKKLDLFETHKKRLAVIH